MANITEEAVLKALSHVDDPDLKKDLVTLNMIKDVKIEGNKISFTVELTTPACPMKDMIHKACVNAIRVFVSKDAEVDVTMGARVNTNRQDAGEVLKGVKNIIAVASGKGGVGKSTVASNLALALAQEGAKVGILDADIYGPSLPIMFGIQGERPMMVDVDGKGKIQPIEAYGLKVMSIGLLIDEKEAVVWRGPMATSALRQFITDVHWGDLDYLILDLPPGTGDIHLTMVQTIPVTGAVVVTTPQTVSVADAKKGLTMFNQGQIKIPILGVIENMAYFTPEELPDNKYYIFGKGGGKLLADQFEVPFLGEIPLIQSIREGGDRGLPVVLGESGQVSEIMRELAQKLAQNVSIRNANLDPTKIVEVQ
ncbi:MAG TPA: Mrp/NBP35 family ATP-binding protein [Chitinophagaceae bacterium]|nr:Mrp/NBP35 family ATP-binding protein [Chitinophagaceae bacterium]